MNQKYLLNYRCPECVVYVLMPELEVEVNGLAYRVCNVFNPLFVSYINIVLLNLTKLTIAKYTKKKI